LESTTERIRATTQPGEKNDEEDNMNRNPWNRHLPLLMLALTALLTFAAACKTTEPVRMQIDDKAITTKVKAKMAADLDMNPFNVDVDTNEGVVTLQGRVKKEETRRKAEDYARDTDGVKRVINLIKVGDINQ
jgi:hyperosmotically inducible protein